MLYKSCLKKLLFFRLKKYMKISSQTIWLFFFGNLRIPVCHFRRISNQLISQPLRSSSEIGPLCRVEIKIELSIYWNSNKFEIFTKTKNTFFVKPYFFLVTIFLIAKWHVFEKI